MKYTIHNKEGRQQMQIEANNEEDAAQRANELFPQAIVLFAVASSEGYNGLIQKKQEVELELENFVNQKIQEFQDETGLGIKEITVDTVCLNQLDENRKVKINSIKITPNLEGLDD